MDVELYSFRHDFQTGMNTRTASRGLLWISGAGLICGLRFATFCQSRYHHTNWDPAGDGPARTPANSGWLVFAPNITIKRFGSALGLAAVLVATLPYGGDAASSPTPGFERVAILSRQAFPGELKGWNQLGPAIFAADTNRTYEGFASARITVESDAELKYQQLRRDFTGGVQPRDEYYASVWVATENVTQPPGAYLALEFLDRQGQRTGIAHGYPGTAPGPGGWRKMETTGRAPDSTVGLRLCLVLHAPGSAWFAAPEVARVGREIPWPDLGDSPREIQIHPDDIVQPRFRGAGFHAFHHIFRASQAELDQVIYKRWRELNPGFVRVNHDSNWSVSQLDQAALHFQRMQETGAEIYLTTWSAPETASAADAPRPERAYADRSRCERAGRVDSRLGVDGLQLDAGASPARPASWSNVDVQLKLAAPT